MKSICTYFLSLKQLMNLGEILYNSLNTDCGNTFHARLKDALLFLKKPAVLPDGTDNVLNDVHGEDMLCLRYWTGLKRYVESIALWPDEPIARAAKAVLDVVARFEHRVPGKDFQARASCFNQFLAEINKEANLSWVKEIGARRWLVCLETSQRAFDIACNNYLKHGTEEALQQSLFGRYQLENTIRSIYTDLLREQELHCSEYALSMIKKIESFIDAAVPVEENYRQ